MNEKENEEDGGEEDEGRVWKELMRIKVSG